MARTGFDMQVSGLMELVEGLRTMQGPELGKVIEASAGRTMRAVVVPAMKRQMASDFKGHRSHKGDKPKRGQSGPAAKNVTVRKVRKRGGELVAIGAGPRAWYAHFPIGGTKAHVITARGVGGRAAARDVRRINRGTASASRALYIRGAFATQVRHPGSRGTDSIRKAVQGVVPQLNARYAADLQAAYDKHIAGPTRRAKPKP